MNDEFSEKNNDLDNAYEMITDGVNEKMAAVFFLFTNPISFVLR